MACSHNSGNITIWHIYALTALQAVAVAFDGPPARRWSPTWSRAKDLPNAFSMTSIAFNTGAILGPGAQRAWSSPTAGQEYDLLHQRRLLPGGHRWP
ncbi:MAG: hypothetical protein M0C28_29260 [Candidatus Moduliflexus flocculans]|nr:hypothetical protein [Candidatus Moduliflexus flocculans]